MKLNNLAVKTAAIRETKYKISDGGGLYVIIRSSGSKNWEFRYKIYGKRKTISLGKYPTLSMKEARQIRGDYSKMVERGYDPALKKKLTQARGELGESSVFRKITEDWLQRQSRVWAPKHHKDVSNRLNNYVLPYIGDEPIQLISAQEVILLIRKCEEKGSLHMAKRCLQMTGQIFRYAVALGLADRDVSVDLRGALSPTKIKHNPTLRENQLPEFLNRLANYNGHILTKYAIEVLLLTMLRT